MYNIMETKNIILFVVIVVLIIVLIAYIRRDISKLTGLSTATTMQQIPASQLGYIQNAGTSNFTYSIWFYVDNWNYRYGEPKILFGRMNSISGSTEPCPSVTLGALQNNLDIALTVYPGIDNANLDGDLNNNSKVHNCSIANIPIQKWVHLLISVHSRTLDVYLDGKLVRTCILPGVAKIDGNAPVFVTPNGGFSGWTSRFQYWPQATDPQTVWNIYRAGYGGSMLGNMFGRYSVKVSVLKGDSETSSFTI
jgi:hypothetical protein